MSQELQLNLHTIQRTSGGGLNFVANLAAALLDVAHSHEHVVLRGSHDSVSAVLDSQGRSQPSEVPYASSGAVNLFPGTVVSRPSSGKVVWWPLNVAPLEPETVRHSSTDLQSTLRYRLLKYRLAYTATRCDAAIFGSEYARSLYLSSFKSLRKLPTVVISGGAPSLGTLISRWKGEESRKILAVAHMYPYKRLEELFEAFLGSRARVDGFELVVAGKEADRIYARRLQEIAAKSEGSIRLLGNINQVELAREYESARLFVITSSSENAGSFTLFDAFAFGVPVICSSLSSLPEFGRNNVRYVNPKDVSDIRTAIDDVVLDSAEQRRLSSLSLARADDVTTWPERGRRCLDFVESELL